jgi:hypothetical protein
MTKVVARTRKRFRYNFCFWGYSTAGSEIENSHQLAA